MGNLDYAKYDKPAPEPEGCFVRGYRGMFWLVLYTIAVAVVARSCR